jgi:hypothetical protein
MNIEIRKKLQLKENDSFVICKLPEELSFWEIDPKCSIDVITERQGENSILIFIKNEQELTEAAMQLSKLKNTDRLLWIAYPKKSSRRYTTNINRDSGWEVIGALGYEPVRQISLSDDWSALRFRQFDKIKKFTRAFAISKEGKRKINE